MAKKKKTQLKPVARGFATTSIPKKSQPVEDVKEEPQLDSVAAASSQQTPSIAQEPGSVKPGEATSSDESILQSLIDKHQENTEKDTARLIKAAQYESSLSAQYDSLEVDEATYRAISELGLQKEANGTGSPNKNESKNQLLQEIGVLYTTLRRVGFSESHVDACLRDIKRIDFGDAVDWLSFHCTEEELSEVVHNVMQGGNLNVTNEASHLIMAESSRPQTPSLSAKSSSSNLSAQRKSGSPAGTSTPSSASHPTVDPGLEGSDDDDDPNEQYVRIKSKLDEMTAPGRRRDPKDVILIGALRLKVQEIKNDYLFQEREAEVLYRRKLKDRERDRLLRQLKGEQSKVALPAVKPAPPPPVEEKVEEKLDVDDIFDDGDGDAPGLFDILEPLPESVVDAITGSVITVRDMPFNKTSTLPSAALKEFVVKSDKFATLSYHEISAGSRAVRAGLRIKRAGGMTAEWNMDDTACIDFAQATQYISTVALFSLANPTFKGFARQGLPNISIPVKRFPSAFRDLWKELEADRKEKDDATNRNIWKTLRGNVDSRIKQAESQETPSPMLKTKQKTEAMSNRVRQPSERLAAGFQSRQAGPAYQKMLPQRNSLPIAAYKKDILELIEQSQVVVLSGETGCGKSTQLPSYILEDQLLRGEDCNIICTEPRRISAVSLAQRVSQELGDAPGVVGTNSSLVGYAIRLESKTSAETRLTYMTTGVALKMLEQSRTQGTKTAFDEVTHVIIDEVHERSIESDFLLIILKSLMAQRPALKVILMSATLDAEKFSKYLGDCPTIQVPGRTFPVEVNYLEDTIEVTGWTINQDSPYAKRKSDQGYKATNWNDEVEEDDEGDDQSTNVFANAKKYSRQTMSTIDLLDERLIPYDLIIRLMEMVCLSNSGEFIEYSAAILVFMPGLAEIRRLHNVLQDHRYFGDTNRFLIYPLHSTISSEEQAAAFDIPRKGVRKVVISTNIAETGVTIPDITCVIDTGLHREMRFDEKRQFSRLVQTSIARSNAKQRRGRAGRVQKGLCFHLFTKSRHDAKMLENPIPEMLRLSLSDLCLRMKMMSIGRGTPIGDIFAQALDPPSPLNVQRAINALTEVNALTSLEEVTPMGRFLSKLPIDVHLGKFLLVATLFRCLDPALTIAAALNSKSPFVRPFGWEHDADVAKQSFVVPGSDFLTIHKAYSAWRQMARQQWSGVQEFCRQKFLSHQNLQQVEELRQQLLSYLIDAGAVPPNEGLSRQLIRAKYNRRRTDFVDIPAEYTGNDNPDIVNAALCAGLYPRILVLSQQNGTRQGSGPAKRPDSALKAMGNNQDVYIHPSSINFQKTPLLRQPELGVRHLCYYTLMHSKRLYAWETGPAHDLALVLLCGQGEFKALSQSVVIDRKIKYRVTPKGILALKALRDGYMKNLSILLNKGVLGQDQERWNELVIRVLAQTAEDAGPTTYAKVGG